MLVAIDLTIITQFWTDPEYITALGIAEVALLITAAVLSFKFSRAQKKLFAAEIEQEEQEIRGAARAEKEQSRKDKNYVENAFDDTDE